MLTRIMMWFSIGVVLLALWGFPVMSEKVVLQVVLCVSGVMVIRQAIHSGQHLLAIGFLPIIVAYSPVSPIALSSRALQTLNWAGLAAFLFAVLVLKTRRYT
jgi:hypothetical protein